MLNDNVAIMQPTTATANSQNRSRNKHQNQLQQQQQPIMRENLASINHQSIASGINKINNLTGSNCQSSTTTNEMSLHSPSSSTSLLYHIYDQINLPQEQQQQQHYHIISSNMVNHNQSKQLPVTNKLHNNITFLNASNLFGQDQQHQHKNQHQQQQQYHQNQTTFNSTRSNHQNDLKTNNNFNNQNSYSINDPYLTIGHANNNTKPEATFISSNLINNQNQFSTTYAPHRQHQQQPLPINLMSDSFVRVHSDDNVDQLHQQHHHQNTSSRLADPNHNNHYTTRPLSQTSQMHTDININNNNNNQSTGHAVAPLIYGRQMRQNYNNDILTNSKSTNNLYYLLESNNNLKLFTADDPVRNNNGGLVNYGLGREAQCFATLHHHNSNLAPGHNNFIHNFFSNDAGLRPHSDWKRLNKSARNLLNRYPSVIKCIALLLIIGLASIILVKNLVPTTATTQTILLTHPTISSTSAKSTNDFIDINKQFFQNSQIYPAQHQQQNNQPIIDNSFDQLTSSNRQFNPPFSPSTTTSTSTSSNDVVATSNNNNNYPLEMNNDKLNFQNQLATPKPTPTPTTMPTTTTTTKCLRCLQNGGKCGHDGRCQCPTGFYGPLCKPMPVTSSSSMMNIDPSRCVRHLNGSTSDDCNSPIERQCDDKIDNDNDGLVDCADSDCCSDKACQDSPLCGKSPDPIDILMRKQPSPPTSSFFQRMQFLINSSQSYTSLKEFNDSRASVIRGRVMYMKKGIPGVRVTVAGNTNLGSTFSRDQGYFDLLVNGGGAIVVQFDREPFPPHQRAVRVPWNEIVLIDPIELSLANTTLTSPITANIGQQQTVIISATNTFDQDQATCFAHNYQLMKPQIVPSPRLSVKKSSPARSLTMTNHQQQHQSSTKQSIAKTVIYQDSSLVQESILLPGGQWSNPQADNFIMSANSNQSQQQQQPVALVYISSKATEFMSIINLQLVPPSSDQFKLPDELKQIHLKIVIEGNLFEQTFEANYNLSYTYAWNRKNVYRQKCFGLSNALVSVGYEYYDCQHVIWSTKQIQLPGYDLAISDIGQQWNLNIHHRYNYRDSILQRGDGQNFNLKVDKPKIVVPLIGDTYQRQTACPFCDGATSAADQRLLKPQSIVSSSDGSLYVGDFNLIRRIESPASSSQVSTNSPQAVNQERLVKTIFEFPTNKVPSKYSLALNLTDGGKLFMADPDHNQVYLIKESPAQLTTSRQQDANVVFNTSSFEDQLVPVVGTGEKCQPDDSSNCGDGQLARLARLVEPKAVTFDLSGRMYLADGRNVRMVDLDEKIYTLLGSYDQSNQASLFPCTGEAIPMHKYNPKNPIDLAINPIDDSLYILDTNVVYRMTQDKRIQMVAGRLLHCHGHSLKPETIKRTSNGDPTTIAGEATGLYLESAQSIVFGPNGDLYISEEDQDRSIARVLVMTPDEGLLKIFAGLPITNTDRKSLEPNIDTLYTLAAATSEVNGDNINTKRSSNFLPSSLASTKATEYKFNSISGLCVDQQGKLIVADRIQLRIVSIESDLPQINQANEYELQSPDNVDEILVFNRYGHHIATKDISSSSPVNKYIFTYTVNSAFGQLASVSYSSGNKVSIYREGPHHLARMIETTFGGQLKLDSSKQVNSVTIVHPNSTKITFAYQAGSDGGLLKHSYDQATGEIYDIQYDEFGRAVSLHFASPKLAGGGVDCKTTSGHNTITPNHMTAMLLHSKVQHNNHHHQQHNQSPLCTSLIV